MSLFGADDYRVTEGPDLLSPEERDSIGGLRVALGLRPANEDEQELMDREGMSLEEVRSLAVPMRGEELHGDALEMHLERMWD